MTRSCLNVISAWLFSCKKEQSSGSDSLVGITGRLMLFQTKKAVRGFPSLSISFRCAVIGIFMKVMTRWYYKLLCQVRTHAYYTTRICVLVRFWAPATIRRSVIIKQTAVYLYMEFLFTINSLSLGPALVRAKPLSLLPWILWFSGHHNF